MKLITLIFTTLTLLSLNTLAEEASNEETINWKSTKDIRSSVTLKLEPQQGEVNYGPNFAQSDKSLLENFSEIYVTRALTPKDEEIYTLFITVNYNDQDWHAYETAKNKAGEELELRTIAKNENVSINNVNYKYEERLAINMSLIDFADAFDYGLELTISGKQTNTLTITSTYFRAML
ncbi:MAG: hypothetical protein ACPHLK_01755 [Gammaproteobacteria bacterium]|jgi:hypothetical protein